MRYTTKAWFGCTTAKLSQYVETYKGIRSYLIKKNCILLYDWLDRAERRMKENTRGTRDIKRIYKDVLMAITGSDVSIIENTVANFSVAHQITYSLSLKKPTLVLWQKKDNESFTDSYLEALESKYLTIKEYTGEGYKPIIDAFLGMSKIEFGQKRYNIVLENKQRYFLDWASSKYKKSRSLIIRDALDRASEEDESYEKDISG